MNISEHNANFNKNEHKIRIPQGMDSNSISSVFKKYLKKDQIQIPHTSDSNPNSNKIFENINSNPDSSGLRIR